MSLYYWEDVLEVGANVATPEQKLIVYRKLLPVEPLFLAQVSHSLFDLLHMEENLSIPSNLHSQVSIGVEYGYLVDFFLFDLSLTDEEYSAFLLIDHEVVLFGQLLEYGECPFKLPLRLDEDEIIGIPSVPYLRVSDSPSPFLEEVFKIDVKEPRA